MLPKIVLYTHNGRSYGHISRICRLAGYLKNEIFSANICCMSSSMYAHRFLPQGVEYLKLPSFISEDTIEGYRSSPILDLTNNEFQNLRDNLLNGFFSSFAPDVLIIDGAPGGRQNELSPWLSRLHKRSKLIWIHQGVRDKSDITALKEPKNLELLSLFDKIVILNNKEVIDICKEYPVFSQFKERIVYAGYFLRQHEKQQRQLNPSKYVILSQIGGGGSGLQLLETIVGSKRFVKADKEVVMDVFTGDYINDKEYEHLRKLAGEIGGVYVNKFSSGIIERMYHSDVFVGSGGYNTLAEIVETKVPAVIIPRQINEKEQEIHTKKLERLGYIQQIFSLDVELRQLGEKVNEILYKTPDVNCVPLSTKGGEEFVHLIKMLLSQ